MAEIRQKEKQFKEAGQLFSEKRLIIKTVLNLFQAYLDDAEEGHYDTAQLTNSGQIRVNNVENQPIILLAPRSANFAIDFQCNSLLLRIRLEERANQIAEQDS